MASYRLALSRVILLYLKLANLWPHIFLYYENEDIYKRTVILDMTELQGYHA